LRRGRWIDPTRPDEVLASEMFTEAHGFNPGDRVAAVINGRRRWLTIVGVALSPRYVYAIRPARWFRTSGSSASSGWAGVRWPPRSTWKAASTTCRSAWRRRSDVRRHRRLDRLLETVRRRGADPATLQISAWTLENELVQLRTFGFLLPLIFYGVAAFILNVALARALALQRPQIAALKALGYSNGDWRGTTSSGDSRSRDSAPAPAWWRAAGSDRR
jgi:putative ABC transport system permease protein